MNMPPFGASNHPGPMFTCGGPPGGPQPVQHSQHPGNGNQMPNMGAGPLNFTGDMPNYEHGNIIRSREIMYRLMISQLFYDGYSQVAIQLTNILAVDPPCPPSSRLLSVINKGLERESDEKIAEERLNSLQNSSALAEMSLSRTEILDNMTQQKIGLNLEYDTESRASQPEMIPEPALYETAYVTSHKANCRAGAFNSDGSLVATGSLDASIKILDVDRMLAKS